MKVLHVITDINRASGGPSRSSQGLVAGLNKAGVETWLVALQNGDRPWVDGVAHFEAIDGAGAFPELLRRIEPDIVHIHGIWNYGLHMVARICRRCEVPYVIAPRGMLEPWSLKQKWLKKRIARFLYQDADLHHAAALHATADSEVAQFRKLGFKNPVIVSPNGVNLPDQKKVGQEAVAKSRHTCGRVCLKRVEKDGLLRFDAIETIASTGFATASQESRSTADGKRALFVSRMHPKKGVLELVESWARVFRRVEDVERVDRWTCELVYTLNGETEREYEAKVKARVLELGLSYKDKDGTIHSSTSTSHFDFLFTGPLSDEAKWDAYARADLFVLPTYSENFGIVVAEALWAGLPVITTKGTPWSELEGNPNNLNNSRCGWWIDLPPKDSLDAALSQLPNLSTSQLRTMGMNGHALVESKYTWTAACKSMVDGYRAILNPLRGNTENGVTEKKD